MAALRLLYDRLGAATGIRLDSESLSVVVSSQIFSLLNYYLGMPRRERAEARPRLRRAVMQLMVGGVLAVRLPEEEATQESAASVADSASD
jgi:hypothetical protein